MVFFRRFFSILSLPVFFLIVACSQHTFDRIPRNGFIEHFAESDHQRMAFDSYWDISDNKDWNQRVTGEKGKSQPICVFPVTLDYFADMPQNPEDRARIQELCNYFNKKLTDRLIRLDAENNTFHLVDKPGPDTYTVRIALLSAKPTNISKNFLSSAVGAFVKGGSLLLSDTQDKGYVSMGAKFYAPNGRLVAEVADFDYGQESLIGKVTVDMKNFHHFAYQRQTIDDWVEQFVKIFTTVHENKIRKPWFKLMPF